MPSIHEFEAPFVSPKVADSPPHPFSPIIINIPGFIATSIPTAVMLTTFFGALAAILALTWTYLDRCEPKLSRGDAWTASWFVLCGFIHTCFEGYFSFHSLNMGSRTDIFGQLWKEYALSDSRYMTRDAFVVCMESVTAYFWGPLSFLCAYYITSGSCLRYPLQLIVSLGQLYGLILYYATCAFEELVHGVVLSRPERVYYYVYYVACNAFWVFIPGWLIYQSVRETSTAFAENDVGTNSALLIRAQAKRKSPSSP